MQAGSLTPIERAERRVLVLANPGHGLERMQASAAMYLGMQLLLPGEWAPAHRHTPNAVRMVVEGEGAWTTVDGQKCPMSRGGVVPAPVFARGERAYPMLRYPWSETRAALEALAADRPDLEAVQVAYVNPETGNDAQGILGFYVLIPRPGQRLALPARSPAAVFHLVEGAGVEVRLAQQAFRLETADTCCAPGFAAVQLANASREAPAFLIIADETPLHRKLGLYEQRG